MVEENKASEGGSSGIAAAMAMGPGNDRANTYLDEQTKLTRLQIDQIEEENQTRRHILKLERASAAMKVAFELAVALIVTIIAVGLGAMIWSAASDTGLVVESFSVPPDLASRGLTGDVIAAKLLDKLSSLQSQTVSSRAPSSYANNWGSDIKLQIPDTGVSIGEFNRSLHTWLGHQTRISGEVYRTPTGIAVTARVGSDSSPTFTGSDADLDKLIRQAAESVYHATQPYRYAVYLANVGRNKEAMPAYLALIANGSPVDRAWALIGLENIYANRADYKGALELLDRANTIRPNFVMSYVNRSGIEGQFQHDELGYAATMKAVQIWHGPRDPTLSETAWNMGSLSAYASLAADVGDYKAQIDYNRQIEAQPEFSGQVENARQNDITGYASLHDGAGARQAYESMPPGNNALLTLQREGTNAFAQMILDHPQAMMAMREKFDKLLGGLGPAGKQVQRSQFWPFVAYGYALQGDFKNAHMWVDKTATDCTQCLSVRGLIDAMEKNWGGADYWSARATRFAPSLPQAFSTWGRILLMKGDTDGAIAKFEAAHTRGPNFADPLEMWGEALLAKHQPEDAISKFEEANKHAPNWARLHLKWGEALAALGRKDEAKAEFARAAGLDISPADKAELERVRRS